MLLVVSIGTVFNSKCLVIFNACLKWWIPRIQNFKVIQTNKQTNKKNVMKYYFKSKVWSVSVPDKWRFSGQKPVKISYMTWQISRKITMDWLEQWKFTHWNSLVTSCLENLNPGLFCTLLCSGFPLITGSFSYLKQLRWAV